jgi:hypothetical protein
MKDKSLNKNVIPFVTNIYFFFVSTSPSDLYTCYQRKKYPSMYYYKAQH